MESATSLNKSEESPYGSKPPQNTLVFLEWWRRDYPTYPVYSEQGVPLLFQVCLNHSPGNKFRKDQILALTMTHHGTTHKVKDVPSSHLFPYSGSEQNFISWRWLPMTVCMRDSWLPHGPIMPVCKYILYW